MSTQEVADKLVALCREGRFTEAIDEFYADNIVSFEPKGAPMEHTEGKEAVKGKTEYWYSTVEEVHSGEISDPVVAGSHFTISMKMDVTYKEGGRMPMEEIAVYEVKDGKIVSEQFFYSM